MDAATLAAVIFWTGRQGREQSVSTEGLSDEELARQLQEQEDQEFYAEGTSIEATQLLDALYRQHVPALH